MPPFLRPVPLDSIDDHEVLLQSAFWGRFKARFGWDPQAFRFADGTPLLALTRRFARAWSLCYIPHGPLVRMRANMNRYFLETVAAHVRDHVPDGCVFIRFDLPWSGTHERLTLAPVFRRAAMDIQPPNTVMLDLTGPEESVLAAMKHKTRYNVRLAEKRGVRVTTPGAGELPRWYALYRETAARDRIAIHAQSYYEGLFSVAAEEPARSARIDLHLAWHEERLLAGIITAQLGRRATYLFGASSNENRNLMATYLVQWRAMQALRMRGVEAYDLFGIPADDDPRDPMHGLYRFKTGFGGTIVHRPGSWDYPLLPGAYRAYRAAEAARRYYYKRLKKGGGAAADAAG